MKVRFTPRRRELSTPWTNAQIGLLLGAVVFSIVVIGYRLLGLSWLDALYQTVITISTVGYREVGTEDVTNGYKLFTIFVIAAGTGIALYTVGVLFEAFIEQRLTSRVWRIRMQRRVNELSGHVVICGWGQVGAAIGKELAEAGADVVIIDRNPDIEVPEGMLFTPGDATDDSVLAGASLDRASVLVVAMDGDAQNVFVTLSGRSSRPDLRIVARAGSASVEPKLRRVGADHVVNPHQIGGHRMAELAKRALETA